MRQAVKSALLAGVLAVPWAASADDTPQPPPPASDHAATVSAPAPVSASKTGASVRAQRPSSAQVSPVAITAKRQNARLDLRLTNDRLSQVLSDSGVQPVAEEDTSVETVEVTGHQTKEPIAQGIPALYYGLTHPTEAWRIFLPIQP
jgi:hypothetical protein